MQMLVTTILLIARQIRSETFTIGYLTGSQRKPGDLEYSRPGLTISGAISLAVEEVNRGILKENGHQLDFIIAETFGEEIISVRRTAELWTQNVSAYIGPQETCKHEAYMAAAFNLPMISYVSWYSNLLYFRLNLKPSNLKNNLFVCLLLYLVNNLVYIRSFVFQTRKETSSENRLPFTKNWLPYLMFYPHNGQKSFRRKSLLLCLFFQCLNLNTSLNATRLSFLFVFLLN